jgi:hypothetical protein
MKLSSALPVIAAGLSAIILSGCVITQRTYVREDRRPYPPERPVIVEAPPPAVVVERPRPVVVVAQPQPAVVVAPAPPPGVIIVHREPPPMIVERVPARPGPEFFWVRGYYAARGDGWVWVPGHYERPPRPGAVWVEPRYERRSPSEVHFSLGFWR